MVDVITKKPAPALEKKEISKIQIRFVKINENI